MVKNNGAYKACLEAYKTPKVTKRGRVTANFDSCEFFGSFARSVLESSPGSWGWHADNTNCERLGSYVDELSHSAFPLLYILGNARQGIKSWQGLPSWGSASVSQEQASQVCTFEESCASVTAIQKFSSKSWSRQQAACSMATKCCIFCMALLERTWCRFKFSSSGTIENAHSVKTLMVENPLFRFKEQSYSV